jgi:hypothetical protein
MSAADERNVLICEGGSGESRAAVSAVRGLAAAGYRPTVTVSGKWSLAGSSKHCSRRVQVPFVRSQPEAFAEAIRAEMASRPYVAVLPTTDLALLALEYPVRHLLDKVECAKLASQVGLATPPSEVYSSVEELLGAAKELEYPIIVKPDLKLGMAVRVDDPAGLSEAIGPLIGEPVRLIVQPYLNDGLHGVGGLIWDGRLVVAAHMRYLRIWPLPCGTVAAAETTEPDRELEARLVELTKGFNGLFHADFAGPYLLDFNPRLHAALSLPLHAGINTVAAYCDLVRGQTVPSARAKPGQLFRWIEGDVRSTLRGLRGGRISAGQALRALMPRRGTAYSYESWRDPGPLAARARFLARRIWTGGQYTERPTNGTAG